MHCCPPSFFVPSFAHIHRTQMPNHADHNTDRGRLHPRAARKHAFAPAEQCDRFRGLLPEKLWPSSFSGSAIASPKVCTLPSSRASACQQILHFQDGQRLSLRGLRNLRPHAQPGWSNPDLRERQRCSLRLAGASWRAPGRWLKSMRLRYSRGDERGSPPRTPIAKPL